MRFNDNSDYFDTDIPALPQPDDADGSTQEPRTDTDDSETGTTAPDSGKPKKRSGRLRRFIAWTSLVVIIGLGATVYLRYFNPYITDAKTSGLVVNVERRGIIFKTFEAEIAPDDAMTGTPKPYSRENFSFANDALAHKLQQYQSSGTPVTLTYSRYFGILPWRGASQRVITSIDVGR